MRWSDVTTPPTDRMLREFAFLAAIVLALLAAWRLPALSPGGLLPVAGYAAAAAAIGLGGLVRPRWLAPVFTVLMIVAFPFGWLVSHLLLAMVYFGLFMPLGLVFRLVGRDPLDRTWPARQDSNWRDKPAADKPERYLQQF